MVVDTAAAGEAAGPVTDTEVAAKCPEVPEVSGAVGVEPAGAVVLLTKFFSTKRKKKVVCSLTNSQKNHVPLSCTL